MKSRPIRLGDLCTLARGTSPTLKTLPGPYPLVVTADFRRTADSWQIEGPAVCIPLISSTGHGDAALHRVHYQEGKFALANLLVALLPKDPNVCSAKYLYHLLMTRKDQLFVPLMLGTANVSLKERDIAAVEVTLPPFPEQRRVVARIEELSGQIQEASNLRRQAVEAVGAVSASYTNAVFNGESVRKWPTKLLGEVAEIRSGVTLGRHLTGETIRLPYLRVANVQDGHLNLATIKEVEILATEREKWRLLRGDVLLTEGGDWDKLGRGAVWRDEIPNCIHQNHIFCVRVRQDVLVPEFLSALTGSPVGKAYFQDASKQTTNLASINQRQLRAFPVFLPPLREQYRILTELDALRAEGGKVTKLQSDTAAELDALLPAILDRAFKGELYECGVEHLGVL